MSWKLVKLEPVENRRGAELQARFKEALAASGNPPDASPVINYDAKHAHRYYFSPDAVRVFGPSLSADGTMDSDAPSAGSIPVLAGDTA